MLKQIQHILDARAKQITKEETVLQPLPHKDFRFANPFIVIHHAGPELIAPESGLRIHPHPHRGFAPVTFMLQGEGYHKDNAGHDEIIRAGDVQWMFAGRGLLHSEGPSPTLLKQGGTQEFIQIWVNVPKAHKWDDPSYQSARKEQQPQVEQEDGVDLRLASGEYKGATGPLKSFTPVTSIVGNIAAGKKVSLQAVAGYWSLLYIANGELMVNGKLVPAHQLIIFDKEKGDIELVPSSPVRLLFLSAEPIDEPVAAKDNFVMNTQEEVEQAMTDYRNGVFGVLSY